jgi:hypothetical protein
MGSTKPEINPVYEQPIELLDESVHYSSVDLVRIINTLIRKINK